MNPKLARLFRDIDRKSKACLNDSVAMLHQDVPAHALALLFEKAQSYADTFVSRQPSDSAPPDLVEVYKAATDRYEKAAQNFSSQWFRKVNELVAARYEQFDDDPTLMERLNAEHGARVAAGAIGASEESDWLVSRIAHCKLTLDCYAADKPLTPGERQQVIKVIKGEIDADRERRERWQAADAHPHPAMLSELLSEGLQELLTRVASPPSN